MRILGANEQRIHPLAPGKFAENGNLKPLMPFSDYCGGTSLANCPKTKLSFRAGSHKSTFGLGMRTKQYFEILTFFFVLLPVFSFSFYFPPRCWPFTRLIYEVKVPQKTRKKVKFLNKKWQVVARPDFPSILIGQI